MLGDHIEPAPPFLSLRDSTLLLDKYFGKRAIVMDKMVRRSAEELARYEEGTEEWVKVNKERRRLVKELIYQWSVVM